MKTGDRIKTLRKKLGISQVELAQKVGVTQHAISAIENNQTKKSGSLIMIAKVLGTTPHELLMGRPAPSETQEISAEYLEIFLRHAPKLLKERGLEPTPELVAKVVAAAYIFAVKVLAGDEISTQAVQMALFRAFDDQLKS